MFNGLKSYHLNLCVCPIQVNTREPTQIKPKRKFVILWYLSKWLWQKALVMFCTERVSTEVRYSGSVYW